MRLNPEGEGNGDEGDRTLNPRLAKAVLSQLSYVPESVDPGPIGHQPPGGLSDDKTGERRRPAGMRAPRFELGTSTLSGWRSNQLSYARSTRDEAWAQSRGTGSVGCPAMISKGPAGAPSLFRG
jgi:hypothetical protein